MKPWVWLLLSTALIVVAVFPWGDFQGHTHWSKVAWIPFVSQPVRTRDIVANLLLFLPFGAAVARVAGPRYTVSLALFSGGVLSISAEAIQLLSHSRFPSATDLVCNSIGSAAGAAMAAGSLRVGLAERRPAE